MKKRFSFWALMLAVALALSLVLTACGKKDDDDKDDGGNTGGGGTTSGGQIALVDASDLADKLFLMYTFEDADVSGKISAIDPYTGAAVESGATYGANSKLVSTPGTNVGGSKKAFDPASDTLTLSNTFADSTFKEMVDDGGYYVLNTSAEEVTGVSVSFWAYNNETYTGDTSGGESADWSNVINTEYLSLTWGNISDKVNASEGKYGAIFPGEDAVLGRAAYPASMYEDAQKNLTQSQITAAPDTLSNDNDWWAFNAISGTLVGSDEDDTDAAKAMAGQCLQTWRYITIDINYKTGISFYANGALAYNYTPNAIEKWYNSSSDKKVSWANMYEYILLGLMENGAMDGSSIIFQLFNGECGIYVDDLIIGQSLTATEAEHLYEDLASAATGTTVDVDTSITSTMGDPGQADAKDKWVAEQSTYAKVTEGRENFFKNYQTLTADKLDSTGAFSYADGTANFSGGDSANFYTVENGVNGYTLTFKGYQVSSVSENDVINNTDMLFFYNFQTALWDGANNNAYLMSTDLRAYYWKNGASISGNADHSWTQFVGKDSITDLSRYCWVETELSWDGESDSVTLKQYIYRGFYADVMNFADTYTVHDYEGYDFEVTKADALYGTNTFTFTKEMLGNADLSKLSVRFYSGAGQSCFFLMEVVDSTKAEA